MSQELLAQGLSRIQKCNPTGDKIMRLHAQTATIENGFVHFPEDADWVCAYMHELTTFPNGRHDDQVDSTSQFLEWLKLPTPGAGILGFYKLLAEEQKRRNRPVPPKTVYARGSQEWRIELGLD